jgi:hypothetical protein
MFDSRTACLALVVTSVLMFGIHTQASSQSGSGSGSGGTGAPSSGSKSSPAQPSPGSKSSPTQSPTGSAPAPTAPAPGSQSAPGTPGPQAPSVAPLSPPPTKDLPGGGGGTAPGGQKSSTPPDSSQASPGIDGSASQRPTKPGGGGDSVEACMGFWDAGTHMSKQEWRTACRRVQNRLQDLSKSSQSSTGQKSKSRKQGKNAPTPGGKAK